MSDNAILAAMRRMGIGKEEMSGHGFRAVARTILDEVLGFHPDYIEHRLAHAVRDPNGRAYNRKAHLAERKKMMQEWADYLDKLKAGATIVAGFNTILRPIALAAILMRNTLILIDQIKSNKGEELDDFHSVVAATV
jgi:hypothetical protein